MQNIIEVGSIVRRVDGDPLRSGAESYGGAVVVSVEPFVLVSEHCDMRWAATININDFHAVGCVSDTKPYLERLVL